jgi:hypothetical protein
MRDWAERYTQSGFHVFPCSGKTPTTTHGVHDAKAHDAPLDEWFAPSLRRDMGIAMGPFGPNGKVLFGVDIDPRHDGIASWIQLVAGREIPDTPIAHSGRGDGGTHLYLFAPPGWTSFPKTLARGVDIKGTGGYLMAPPSRHEDTGEAYTWERDPWSCGIADAPRWMLDLMASRPSATLVAAPLADHFVTGERNNMLASIAGSVRRRGMTAAEILPLLEAVNHARCRPPLDGREVLKIAESAERNMDAADAVEPGAGELGTKPLTGLDLAKPLPPLHYLVERIGMPSGGGPAHIIGGFGFSGKTVVSQALLLSLAVGASAWGAFTGCEPQKVTHVDNEQGIATTQRRYQRLANTSGRQLEELGDSLRLFTYPKMRNGNPIKLIEAHRNAWTEIMSGRDVVLIDSLDATRDGSVKQSDAEVRSALDLLGSISEETKCRPLVIHHANKASLDGSVERDPRAALAGSQAIFAACDSIYLLTNAKGEPVKVTHIKSRSHGDPVDDWALSITDQPSLDDSKWGLAVRVVGVEAIAEARAVKKGQDDKQWLEKTSRKVVEALSGHPLGLGKAELGAVTGLSGGNLTKALVHLGGRVNVSSVKVGRVWQHLHTIKS